MTCFIALYLFNFTLVYWHGSLWLYLSC